MLPWLVHLQQQRALCLECEAEQALALPSKNSWSSGGSVLVPGSGEPAGRREADLTGLTPLLLFRVFPGGEGPECPTDGPWGAWPSYLLQGEWSPVSVGQLPGAHEC